MTLAVAFFLAAVLYSAVGRGGASGHLAAMAFLGVAPAALKPTALVLDLRVASIATLRFANRRTARIGARDSTQRCVPLLLALLLPLEALGQPIGHPLPPGLRPFHDRVAGVDVAAVVRVERVDEGRIAVVREDVLAGAPPERFEVKRSPLAPPPLATGDRALLLLRGARPPYIFADEPAEVIRLSDDAMAARWSAAVRSVITHRNEPAALVPIYLDWIDKGPETLREIGRISLLDLATKHPEVRAKVPQQPAPRPSAR